MLRHLLLYIHSKCRIVDNTENVKDKDLVLDLVQIVTDFSCRLQGKRSNKANNMIKELLENDTGDED